MTDLNTKTVIFCGGQGTRFGSMTRDIPKPLIPVGEKPILWHIMKGYSHHGFNDFVLCLGYKGQKIKDFFADYQRTGGDISVKTRTGETQRLTALEDWKVTLAETGDNALTARRLYTVRPYLESSPRFMITYGDGVSDVNVKDLMQYHARLNKEHGTLLTVTGVHPRSKWGEITVDDRGLASGFEEKPLLRNPVNGGFMVAQKEFLDHPMLRENIPLEVVIQRCVEEGKVGVFPHKGFWFAMDSVSEYERLNELWGKGNAPWATWEKKDE